jgi:hypothetical protein
MRYTAVRAAARHAGDMSLQHLPELFGLAGEIRMWHFYAGASLTGTANGVD